MAIDLTLLVTRKTLKIPSPLQYPRTLVDSMSYGSGVHVSYSGSESPCRTISFCRLGSYRPMFIIADSSL